MQANGSVGKGRTVEIPQPGDVIFGAQAAPLFRLFNALMKLKIIPADKYDFQIGDNAAQITVPANQNNSGTGTGNGPVWLP